LSNRTPSTGQVTDRQRRAARYALWDSLTQGEKALLVTRSATVKDIRRARKNAEELAREAA
jgi:hypothetical protein